MSKISIIIPAYDERENLPMLVKALDRTFRGEDFEIIIVNDENPDGSVEIIRKLENEYTEVKGLLSNKLRGKAKAIRDGFKESKGEVIVLMDADLQYLAEDVPRLIKALSHVDVVNGLRVDRKDSMRRNFESKVYNLLVRTIFSVEFNDCNSGLKVFKRKVMDDIVDQLRDGWHRYLLVLAVRKEYKVKEIPVRHRSRTTGRSKFSSPLKLFKGFLDLLSVKIFNVKERPPSKEEREKELAEDTNGIKFVWQLLTASDISRCPSILIDSIVSETRKSGEILEVGSGKGQLADTVRQRGFKIVATDLITDFMRKNYSLLPIVACDAQVLPFQSGVFDSVISIELIEHLYDVDMHLGEVRRVLRNGGIYFLKTPNKFLHDIFYYHHPQRRNWREMHPSVMYPFTLEQKLKGYGFKVEFLKTRTIQEYQIEKIADRLGGRMLKEMAEKLLRRLPLSLIPRSLQPSFIYIARKTRAC